MSDFPVKRLSPGENFAGDPSSPWAAWAVTPGQGIDVDYVVQPSASLADLNAAIAEASAAAAVDGLQRVVYLPGGIYQLGTILGASRVRLKGQAGRTILRTTATGGADVPTNAAILADGTINASKMSTTLTAAVPKNSTSIAVAAAGTIAAGDYILIEGHNDAGAPQDGLTESDGTSVVLSEIVRVDASYVSGLTIPLAWPTRQHHGTNNITVRAITPVVDFEVCDLTIQGSTGGATTANGIFARYCVGFRASGIATSGCSRMAVDVLGCRDVRLEELHSKGTNNGWLMLTSVIGARVRTLTGDQGVARVHPSGYPRYPVLLRSRCTDCDIDDVHLTGVAAGMYVAGAKHTRIGDVDVTDVTASTAVYDRMVLSGEIQDTALLVLGFGTGYGPLALAEFAFDVTIESIRVEDVRAPNEAAWTNPAPFKAQAVYLHDVLNGHVGQISVINRGITGNTHLTSGVMISDYLGHIDSISVAGYVYGLAFANSQNHVVIDRYRYVSGGGQSPGSTIPIYVDHSTPNNHTIHIREASFENASSGFRTGPSFAGDFRFRIDHLVYDGVEWTDVIIGRNESATSFTQADVVEMDATHQVNDFVRVVDPNTGVAAHERRLAAVVSGAPNDLGTGYMLVCPLPARLASVKATTAAVNKGALIEYAATRRCAEDAAAAHPFGKSLTYKAAGAEGIIRVTLPVY